MLPIRCNQVPIFVKNVNSFEKQSINNFVRTIHLVYIPWHNKTQKIKEDRHDFDHTYYNDLVQYCTKSKWSVKLWHFDEIKEFIELKFTPQLWSHLMKYTVRPIQIVDFVRNAIVYFYGGLSMQYGSRLYDVDIDDFDYLFIPTQAGTRLWTEKFLTLFQQTKSLWKNVMKRSPSSFMGIRNQLVSAYPKSIFLQHVLITLLVNITNHVEDITNDRAILESTGPHMVSHVYHSSNHNDTELISFEDSQFFNCNSHSSWRNSACLYSKTPPSAKNDNSFDDISAAKLLKLII
jgi:hypothetical protein